MATEQVIRQLSTPQDRNTIIEKFDSSEMIRQMVLSLLGISIKVNRTASQTTITRYRDSRPRFTEEFVKTLERTLWGQVNSLSSFTVFSHDEKRVFNSHVGKATGELIGLEGNLQYISSQAWRRIMAIHDLGRKDNPDPNYSGWKQFNINWRYEDPVTDEMLQIAKKIVLDKDTVPLEDEELDGQETFYQSLALDIRFLAAASKNRSTDLGFGYGMTTDLLKETTIEKSQTNVSNTTEEVPSWS